MARSSAPLHAKERSCMPENDKVITVVHEWVIKAENDLRAASHILKLGEECPTDTVCFHAQQCVEKYLKAFLVLEGIDFPKTHDIEVPRHFCRSVSSQSLRMRNRLS